MYIPNYLRATQEMVDDIAENPFLTLEDIVRVHYCYSHDTADFDGGLNLFDALKRVLSEFYESAQTWDIEDMKKNIREAEDPEDAYMSTLESILIDDMIHCYGY